MASPSGPAFSFDEASKCPICQDSLRNTVPPPGEERKAVVTTLCNHDFHSKCLLESPDSVCAVCRFNYEPCIRTKCCVCASDDDLWMCTVCCHTGCGRTVSSHAEMHFRENPDHNIARNIGTQKVWDYKADNWVFDPQCFPPASEGFNGFASQEEADEALARQVGGKSLEQMSLNSKLEAIGTEYNYVLVSLLDSQKQ
jgi:BRCA1-associated protein